MIAASGEMKSRDFVLLGCSVAVTIVLLWPDQSDRQQVRVVNESGQYQRYSVPVDDPSLQVLKRRLSVWRNPSSHGLRVARWHHELADFYCEQEPNKKNSSDVAQVSYADGNRIDGADHHRQFWSQLRDKAQLRIGQEQEQLKLERAKATPPVVLGPIVRSINSPLAFPLALLTAAAITMLAIWRQRACPPIQLVVNGTVSDLDEDDVNPLPIPRSWVKIHHPVEVVLWRIVYGASVATAGTCLVFAKLA